MREGTLRGPNARSNVAGATFFSYSLTIDHLTTTEQNEVRGNTQHVEMAEDGMLTKAL